MNWLMFAVTAYLLAGLEIALRGLPVGQVAGGSVAPSLLLVLLVFVGLSAPAMTVAWAALILGVLVDLQPTTGDTAVIGPAAVAYLLGAYAVVQLRGTVFRDSTLTLAVSVVVAGLLAHPAEVAIYSLRGLPWLADDPIPGWRALPALAVRFLSLLVTAAVSVPLGWMLLKTRPVWQFTSAGRNH